jgi:cytosine deaminase
MGFFSPPVLLPAILSSSPVRQWEENDGSGRMFAPGAQRLRPDAACASAFREPGCSSETGDGMAFVRGDMAVLNGPAYRLANARIPLDLAPDLRLAAGPGRLASADLLVESGCIARITPPGESGADGLPGLDLRDGLALPRFVDMHTHLDKGHIAGRAPNPYGTFLGARTSVAADREANWSAADVRARMDFALRSAFAHGTGAIRTHLDCAGKQTAITWPVFDEMRQQWAGRIALQAVALFPYEYVLDDEAQFRSIVEIVARHGGVLGGLTFMGYRPDERLDRALDRLMAAATAHGLDLDFHVDESESLDACSLEHIADAAVRNRFPGRITAGHCCSLALFPDDHRRRVIDKVGAAGIGVVSLPMCNMYLQDRQPGRTPRWRGVVPLHELAEAGVTVAVASDNTRDPFYAYGDLDMVEVFREATRILQLDHSGRPWTDLLGPVPAGIMGLDGVGTIREGGPADLVLVSARNLGEFVARPQTDRIVLVAGRPIDTTPPDYRELDALAGR